ncbi:hypothetical protein ASD54_17620 [Rhizobium sp. Root149]|uniref:cupin domain-containing protein n=1 Tax=Rhizobium sp. Root149 TaxID=1736473 RepID=UPI000714F7D8|nr:cupin domain-containing protein [Rhizobium sp. Root149]KQZ48671.1 hypothetical protein ASD54_17620 [Rhizobium sp. Root149]
MAKEEVIAHLELSGHFEGGYFRETFRAVERDRMVTSQDPRTTMTSILSSIGLLPNKVPHDGSIEEPDLLRSKIWRISCQRELDVICLRTISVILQDGPYLD